MWIAYTHKGKRIVKDFWDWCLMNVCLENYMDEGLSKEAAWSRFWNDVRNYDPEDFDACLKGRTVNDALGDGDLDEIRADYLYTLNIESEQIKED